MSRVTTYFNFARSTEEAFNFYKSVFGTDFSAPTMRMGDLPPQPGQPPMSEADAKLIMHMALPILGGHVIMGTDVPEGLTVGNNVTINLEPDTLAEANQLFDALAEGGQVETALQPMFWGGHFGILIDKFGMRWMFNCSEGS